MGRRGRGRAEDAVQGGRRMRADEAAFRKQVLLPMLARGEIRWLGYECVTLVLSEKWCVSAVFDFPVVTADGRLMFYELKSTETDKHATKVKWAADKFDGHDFVLVTTRRIGPGRERFAFSYRQFPGRTGGLTCPEAEALCQQHESKGRAA